MNKKYLSLLSGAVLTAMYASSSMAAPLPAGTKLLLTAGAGSGFNAPCPTGSCFGMQTGTKYLWTDINSENIYDPDGAMIGVNSIPGNDPGIILGKNQISGGQDLAPSALNTTAGDITGAWNFGGNYGTFYTAPGLLSVKDPAGNPVLPYDGTMTLGADANLFDDAGCALATCVGKTELKVWNVAWNGGTIPMGSQYPCVLSSCSANQKAGYFITSYVINPVNGGAWSLSFNQVVPFGGFAGFGYRAILRGTVELVPIPAAVWLFGSGLVGLAAVARRKKGHKT